ncbi:cyclic nucleotide-binding domain-containing protein [Vibrio sp. SS-MA-C1-2]|uniref:Crp/Fnr family transcriptional regulator n=1 Tax=Vibrio sp. SS-MA-C1-2 TaxID=2908646 RepID=UPI001F2132E0|nr:cyclic nucleotide-binding domain-containing protein [Vibrio sp. SS-MA-C1-2]UJF19173.1 cyclic nucleotide-binding domain-containing protein [Vibrio sp. SS-MA-C1-2]
MNALLRKWIQLGETKEYKRNDVILSEGDKTDSLYIIYKGAVIIQKEQEREKLILDVLSHGELFCEEACLGVNAYPLEVKAMNACTIVKLPIARIKEDPEFLTFLLTTVIYKKQSLFNKAISYRYESTKQQLLGTLIYLSRKNLAITHPEGRIVKVSRITLSGIILRNRETVGRTLKELEAEGLIKANGMEILLYHNTLK